MDFGGTNESAAHDAQRRITKKLPSVRHGESRPAEKFLDGDRRIGNGWRWPPMTRAVNFTQAQIRRAVKAAESAGLRVRKVTINPDGSITIDTVDDKPPAIDSPETATSWDDV